ncbi:DUF4760 domain-containing protein [Serratia ureilytica]|uniref:DUF4760 domain-containing protein n=1 Tax=Serratia ureilytica TaxID=300181 RepID=UPI0018D9DF00|nr:DUF4760 domain-containing protein [Serratia ureilytica]MBH3155885.1 DUF4760 domain-containing protein [Serratia ureilytica]MBH3250975.1 DUF4760 domain-containing protein [Serratia ureilytica]
MTTEIINLSFNFIMTYALLVAVFLYMRSARDKKKRLALDYIRRWNDEGYFKSLYNIEHCFFSDGYKDKIDAYSDDLFIEHSELNHVLAFFEELSLAILNNQADEKISQDFFVLQLATTFIIADKMLMEQRKVRGKGLYRNVERLYGKWLAENLFHNK